MEPRHLTALVLAAGLSRRLVGQPKQLLPWRGTTLLGWIVAQAETSAAVDEVIVTLGQASEEILASLTLRRARPVVAQEYAEGCAASYQGVLGHPLIFDRRLFPELAALHGDKAAWKLLDTYPDRIACVELNRPAPVNINTLADYAALVGKG
ncbi:MAG: NTP transferase domain-containing protein [Ktedonobacterales bacterium]